MFSSVQIDAGEQAAPKVSKFQRLSKKLGLTNDQKTQLKSLFETNKDKLKALKDTDRQHLKIDLTPEQKVKLKALQQKRQQTGKINTINKPQ